MVNKNKIFLAVGVVAVVLLVAVVIYLTRGNFSEESFKVNTLLLKSNIVAGGELATEVKVTNQKSTEQIFNVYFSGLEGVASIDETRFSISEGDDKTIQIFFNDTKDEVGVYVGYLVVETSDTTKKIPVILTVEEVNPFFTIIQKPLPKYENVIPGGKVGMDIKIYSLKTSELQNVNVNYVVKNFDGDVLSSEDEKLAFEKSYSVSKVISLDKSAEKGDYIFITSIEHNGKSVSAYYFDISEEESTGAGTGFSLSNLGYILIFILLFVIGMFWLIFKFFGERNKITMQLQKQQNFELDNNLNLMKQYRRELRKIDDISKRRQNLERLELQKQKIIENLKEKHRRQREEVKKYLVTRKSREEKKQQENFRKLQGKYEKGREEVIRLRDKNKGDGAIKKLKEKFKQKKEVIKKKEEETIAGKLKVWKNQGYNMSELKSHIRDISHDKIKSQIAQWKKEGYNL